MSALRIAASPLPPTEPVVAAVVDRSDLFRTGLAGILASRGITVAGGYRDVRQATPDLIGLQPDVILLEAVHGEDVVRRLVAAAPDSAVVMLSSTADEDVVLRSIAGGARGFLLKDAEPDEFAAAVSSAAAGGCPTSARAAVHAFDRLRDAAAAPRSTESALTPRETGILELLAGGLSNNEIAARLVVSPITVKHHVASILEKLGAGNRVQAAVYAVRRNLV